MRRWFKEYFDYFFLILSILELAFVQYYPEGRVITKPLLLISLMIFYVISSEQVDWLLFTALGFAFLGDTFLLSGDYFLFGLGSFLIMQLLYAYCFWSHYGHLNVFKIAGIMTVALLTGCMLYLLLPDLNKDMKVPVVIYSGSIALMAITAIARTHQRKGYAMIMLGVISFLISDSFLGLNKFGGGNELFGLLVMPTYILAQYLIVKGYLTYELSNNASVQT